MADVRARLLSVHAEYQKAFMPMIVFGGGLVRGSTAKWKSGSRSDARQVI